MHLNQYSETKTALGGQVSINIVTSNSEDEANNLINKLWKYVFNFEKKFSRFIPSSELSDFNRKAGTKTFISDDFREILIEAKRLAEDTSGLYNPFILSALQRAGYIKSSLKGYEDDYQEDHSNKSVGEIDMLEIGKDYASIPYGTAIDLGGCGKGYLADKLLAICIENKIHGCWINLSGDIITYGLDANNENICLDIQDASVREGVLDFIIKTSSDSFAVATSGTFRRPGTDLKKHHIINPTTLEPADTNVLLATVCAKTCIEADVLASCAVILGNEKADNFLKKHDSIGWIIQYKNSQGKTLGRRYGDCFSSLGAMTEKIYA